MFCGLALVTLQQKPTLLGEMFANGTLERLPQRSRVAAWVLGGLLPSACRGLPQVCSVVAFPDPMLRLQVARAQGASQKGDAASSEPWVSFPRFSRERTSREESWEHGRGERGAADWRLESSNGKTASRRSEEKEAGEI